MALLHCHGDSDCDIFPHADIVNAQTWEVSPLKKSSQATLYRFRSVKRSNRSNLECLGHFNGIVPSLACILTKQHGVCGGKYLLKTPGNAIPKTLNFKMFLDASAFKNLCLWCEFLSCLLFIISVLLKNVLTAPAWVWNIEFLSKQTVSLASNPYPSLHVK